MLTEKIKSYLSENTDEVLDKGQEKYSQKLKELGFNDKINSSFIEFMTRYSDEHYGSEGLLNDVMMNDLMDYENGVLNHLIKNYNVPDKYIPFSIWK